MYLLDTMVLSKGLKRQRHPDVVVWMERSRDEEAFLSVRSLGEIERGICKIANRDPDRSERYRSWLQDTVQAYADRVLPVTEHVARRWGRLSHDLGNANPDLFIAATALVHDLTVVTRNVRHFEPTGVKLFNPYKS
ncbi:type II toxin-antitoxin system VapC family toxin [Jiella sp. M17.18]|uniref:type II toxin-antitoxin system VapC family toxin n=1 Tax=Jiella sp. M17.18 TaxID=3234247 RepID=UPI0034DEFE56